ncbi:MAG: aldo/keto reductase [Mycobacteriaceae bacterium]|nr:aldo/keto reductase [Mycobacteriaceae bacterium]
MPALGFGVFKIPDGETFAAVSAALESGYRSIDTASVYGNETATGRAIRESGIARDDIFVTTKVWNTDQGYDSTLRAFEASRARLGMDYVDLYLVHWPVPAGGRFVDTYRALQKLRADGLVRSLGVSNFTQEHLLTLIDAVGEAPVLNQVELHPRFTQRTLRDFHLARAIATEAWAPLGQGGMLADPTVTGIALDVRRTPAQVLIRWHLQLGNIVIPKSSDPARIAANARVFDFELNPAQMRAISGLDTDTRLGPDPDEFS